MQTGVWIRFIGPGGELDKRFVPMAAGEHPSYGRVNVALIELLDGEWLPEAGDSIVFEAGSN